MYDAADTILSSTEGDAFLTYDNFNLPVFLCFSVLVV